MQTRLDRRSFLVASATAMGLPASAAGPAFQAVEVNHVALRVADLEASEEFYRKMFGAPGIIFEKPGQRYLRLGRNFVALFERGEPSMDHFAISVRDYAPDAVQQKLDDLGLETRRSSSFVYVKDPDGIEVQVAHAEHEVDSPVVRPKPDRSVFRGVGVNHVALGVRDIGRSRDFYTRLFDLPVEQESGGSCFLGVGDNFLALFRRGDPGMDHFCIAIEDYDPARVMDAVKAEGLDPRREADRVYFKDPNGLTVQTSAPGHQP